MVVSCPVTDTDFNDLNMSPGQCVLNDRRFNVN